MPILTNSKHELFVQNIAEGMSQVKAYQSAGYDANDRAASVAATRLLANPKIKARLDELLAVKTKLLERSMQQTHLTKQWVIEKLKKNAMIALGEEKVKVSRVDKETGTTIEMEVVDRDPAAANKALELLGKTLGVFIERKEVGGPGDFTDKTIDELRDILARDMAALGLRLTDVEDQGRSRKAGSQLN